MGWLFIYGITGKTCMLVAASIVGSLPIKSILQEPALLMGLTLLIAGLGFKIASFPFPKCGS